MGASISYQQLIKAKLTTFDTTMIVVSLVIGIGIFRTPAIMVSGLPVFLVMRRVSRGN